MLHPTHIHTTQELMPLVAASWSTLVCEPLELVACRTWRMRPYAQPMYVGA